MSKCILSITHALHSKKHNGRHHISVLYIVLILSHSDLNDIPHILTN